MLMGAQIPEQAETAEGWCVSTAPSLRTPGWSVTAPLLILNPCSEIGAIPGEERGQAVGEDTSEPAGMG